MNSSSAPWPAGSELEDGTLGAQLIGHNAGHEVVLGLEVCIERAVGQPRIGHEGRDP